MRFGRAAVPLAATDDDALSNSAESVKKHRHSGRVISPTGRVRDSSRVRWSRR